MKETVEYFKQQLIEAKDVARMQWKAFVEALVFISFFYVMGKNVPPGWISWAFIAIPCIVMIITAYARVNEIGPEKMGARWQVRKMGLIMSGTGAGMILISPFSTVPTFPTWTAVILVWGVAFAWLTTPGATPWDFYVSGQYKYLTHPPNRPERPRSPLHRVVGRVTGQHSVDDLMRREKEYQDRIAKEKKEAKK